jgi:SEC-C motif
MNTTPKTITQQILDFCKTLDATQVPVYLPLTHVQGTLRNECYPNVENQIKKHGGSIQYGWAIWENPNILIEGLFHACWRDDSGKLFDITPKDDGEQQILFLPDTKRKYEGVQIDNERLILTKNPRLIESFRVQSELNKLQAKYSVDGRIAHIPEDELIKLGLPVPKDGFYIDSTGRMPTQRGLKVGRNDPCPCGSGLKYKRCCIK